MSDHKGGQTGDEQVQESSQCRLMLRGAEQNAKAQRPSTQGLLPIFMQASDPIR